MNEFSRTELLIGQAALEKLQNSRVAIFGVGGVGGYVCEALVRSGVGHFDLIDNDTVSLTNINRQIIALHSTIGKLKVDVMKERMLDINPDVDVSVHPCFYLPETVDQFDFSNYDYVVDAIDTVTGKIEIIVQADAHQVPVISSMGAGNKLNPAMMEVSDIYKTSVCPLARVMRRELKKRHIKHCKVVYSKEKAIQPSQASLEKYGADSEENFTKKSIPGSTAFVPSVAGLILASEVIKDLITL
ncbi:uBA/THIF-type NAD/FAD binding protein [Firmicutes bacterium CAG:536]|nr:uBA/THIF-type NAD/FAD binding protein [Firmicutes bacterium CAG:536]